MHINSGGSVRVAALLGFPVGHSLSPYIHNRVYTALKLPYVYVPLPVRADDLRTVIDALAAVSALGANVTVPHKQAAAACCDELSPLSRRLGTVNTLSFEDGRVSGTTTDPEGFLRALAAMGFDPAGSRIVILGNGGTARTLAAALAFERKPAALTLAGRSIARVRALAAEISTAAAFPVSAVETGGAEIPASLESCDLLVNCTSAGMVPDVNDTPLDRKFLRKGMAVFDAVYNPAETRLLAEARAAGCRVQNGLRMLLCQALASIKVWTGIDVDESLVDLNELKRRCSA